MRHLYVFLFSLFLFTATNAQNVGIGTNSPTAKLTINGNLALLSDTVRVNCNILQSTILIDNILKPKSIFHLISDNCAFQPMSPTIVGLSGGTDGKIVTIITHLNNTIVRHLQGINGSPSPADSVNMIEFYEPNNNGTINQPSYYLFNAGGSITLIYDGIRNRWKLLNYNGDVKTESFGWYKGSNSNDIYNPNAGNVGIGTSSPNAALEVKSTTNGFLLPRLTILQRNAIKNPATGLVIFCNDCFELQVFDGVMWKSMLGTPACQSAAPPSITICNIICMPNNLNVSNYRNGDPIPQVTNPTAWANLSTGAWCWYNNDSATYASTYGKLYNWYAVKDPRGLAPEGWHIPGNEEWTALTTCLGGDFVAGGRMKETGIAHWINPNYGASNSSGFTGLPGGFRDNTGVFAEINRYGYFWSSSFEVGTDAYYRNISFGTGIVTPGVLHRAYGFSIRCVRD